jgi:hypothetical protein
MLTGRVPCALVHNCSRAAAELCGHSMPPHSRTYPASGCSMLCEGSTQSPDILSPLPCTCCWVCAGRVKTLHPGVHGGILAIRDNQQHMAAIQEHNISTIDLVRVGPGSTCTSLLGAGSVRCCHVVCMQGVWCALHFATCTQSARSAVGTLLQQLLTLVYAVCLTTAASCGPSTSRGEVESMLLKQVDSN